MAGNKNSGRKKGKSLSPKVQEEIRAKIDGAKIINSLVSHIEGETKMEASQVTASNILLKKILPDLSSTEMNYGDETLDKISSFLGSIDNASRGLPEDD